MEENNVKPAGGEERHAEVDAKPENQGVKLSAAGTPLSKNWLAVIAIIWSGQAVSMITSYAASFAAVWYVTESTGSALALAALTVCAFLPTGLISPFAGVVADRFNRKHIMILADGFTGLASLALGFAILAGYASFELIALIVIARAVGQAFHSPSMMATMPLLVPPEHLTRINALDQTMLSIAGIGAPAFGMLLYVNLGFHSVMFLDAFGALCAVAGLALAKVPLIRDEEAASQHVLANMKDGFMALRANRGLLVLMVGIIVGMIVFAPVSAVYPLMTYEYFALGGYEAALVEGVFAGFMLVGSVIIMVWGGGHHPIRLIVTTLVLCGMFTALCGVVPQDEFFLFVILVGFMSLASAMFNGPFMSLIQTNIAPEKLGRVMGLLTAGMGLASPIGIAIGGVVAEAIGVAPFFVVVGVLYMLVSLALLIPKSVRALDHQAPASFDAGE